MPSPAVPIVHLGDYTPSHQSYVNEVLAASMKKARTQWELLEPTENAVGTFIDVTWSSWSPETDFLLRGLWTCSKPT